jgi:hypothetical protein
MKQIDKIKKQLIKEAEYGIDTYWEFSDDLNNPRWIEWSLNAETWVVCSGRCKCGNQNLSTENTFSGALEHFTDEQIMNYYKQQEVA